MSAGSIVYRTIARVTGDEAGLLHRLEVIKHTTDTGSRTHSARIFVFGEGLNEDTPVHESSTGEHHSKKLNQIKPFRRPNRLQECLKSQR